MVFILLVTMSCELKELTLRPTWSIFFCFHCPTSLSFQVLTSLRLFLAIILFPEFYVGLIHVIVKVFSVQKATFEGLKCILRSSKHNRNGLFAATFINIPEQCDFCLSRIKTIDSQGFTTMIWSKG